MACIDTFSLCGFHYGSSNQDPQPNRFPNQGNNLELDTLFKYNTIDFKKFESPCTKSHFIVLNQEIDAFCYIIRS